MANFFTKLFRSSQERPNAPIYDDAGNIFYPRDLFYSHGNRARTNYDMHAPIDRVCALAACTPLAGVLDKLGNMLSRCEMYVVDDEGNELTQYDDVLTLLQRPNPLQSFAVFFKQLEIELRLHGFVVVKLVRTFKSETPRAMWICPPELTEVHATGKVWEQYETDGVVKRVSLLTPNGARLDLQPHEYILITDGRLFVPSERDGLISFHTAAETLSYPVNNWIAAMAASNTLLINGGPKGIIHGEGADNFGQTAVTKTDEEEIREQFKRKYGLVGKRYPILVTRHVLRWQPIDFNAAQLRIDENDERCTAKICNTFGINPNLFTDAKYDNQESAKKAAYQDVIIPDSKRISEALSHALLAEVGGNIVFDYSAVECLQESKREEAQVISTAADALLKMLGGGLVSHQEARELLSKYIDINPADVVEQPKQENDE